MDLINKKYISYIIIYVYIIYIYISYLVNTISYYIYFICHIVYITSYISYIMYHILCIIYIIYYTLYIMYYILYIVFIIYYTLYIIIHTYIYICIYIYIVCVCFRCHDISKHVLPHPEHPEQKRTGSKPSSPPHFVVRRGLWILSCRFSSGSVQNEISVAMFFVVPSVTLLSLKIYIYMEKKNRHSSKSCSVSRVSR